MCYQRHSTLSYQSLCFSVVFASFLAACSSTPARKGSPFDLSQVDKMQFTFEGNTQFLGMALPLQEMSREVTTNLSGWGYQFANQNSNQYTHDLSIRIGSIHYGSTPAGFSFSSGNSDPRALDFQKANTIPLTCALMPKAHQQQRAELTMEVMADEYKGTDMISVSQQHIISRLSDDISTTCFNLLSSLNIKTKVVESSHQIITPTWMPKIRVEIEDIPEKKTVTRVKNNDTMSSTSKNNSIIPKKRIIIHNQGSPVIFKFGPDR